MRAVKGLWAYLLLPILTYLVPYVYMLLVQFAWVAYDELFSKALYVEQILIYSPFSIALVSLIYGLRRGFAWSFPIFIGLTFIIALVLDFFFFPNASGLESYMPIYMFISLLFMSLGSGLGFLLRKWRKKA